MKQIGNSNILDKPTSPFPFGQPITPGTWGEHFSDTIAQEGNDAFVLRRWKADEEPEVLRIEDFGTNVIANFPGHEQEIVDFLLNNRAHYGVQTILDAGLSINKAFGGNHTEQLYRHIFTAYDLDSVSSYAYLSFSDKGWSIYLNGTKKALQTAKWDDLEAIRNLALRSQNDIRALEIELAVPFKCCLVPLFGSSSLRRNSSCIMQLLLVASRLTVQRL